MKRNEKITVDELCNSEISCEKCYGWCRFYSVELNEEPKQ
jgi:hypothetical protein